MKNPFRRKTEYVPYSEFEDLLSFKSLVQFQQGTRQQTLLNTIAREEDELRHRAPFL